MSEPVPRTFEGYAVEDRDGIQYFGTDRDAVRDKGEWWAVYHNDWEVYLRKVTITVHEEETVSPTPP